MHHVSATDLMEICLFSSSASFLTFYVDEAARSKSFGIADASSTSGGAGSTSITIGVHSLVLKLFGLRSCSASFFRCCLHFLPRFEYDGTFGFGLQ